MRLHPELDPHIATVVERRSLASRIGDYPALQHGRLEGALHRPAYAHGLTAARIAGSTVDA